MKPVKVIIATDGTPASIDAGNLALSMLHPDAEVTLVTIVDERHDPMEDAGGFEGPVMTDDEADAEYEQSLEHGREALATAAAAITAADVHQRLVPSGRSVDRSLRAVVEEEQPDLLVLGSHDEGWFQRFLHGSVEERLIHHVPCPILVVGHHRSSS